MTKSFRGPSGRSVRHVRSGAALTQLDRLSTLVITIRVLVWNMQSAFSTVEQEAKWAYLDDQAFDVALLQEVADPRRHGNWRSVVWRPRKAANSGTPIWWGSAVVSRAIELEEPSLDDYPWLTALEGSTAIARTTGVPNWFASVHASATIIDEEENATLPVGHIPRAVPDQSLWQTDVLPYELRELFGDEPFVWGGDLNSAEAMDSFAKFAGGNRKLREIWRRAGSVDLRLNFFEEEQQTFFAPGKRPWQLDHLFADAQTARRVTSWRVDRAPVEESHRLSDHAPIVIEITPLDSSDD